MFLVNSFYSLSSRPLTSVRLASDTPSVRSMSVPSDLQRGREVLLVVVALIRWAAMLRPVTVHQLVCSGSSDGFSC